MEKKLQVGIVGYGKLGRAVEFAFTHPHVKTFIVDTDNPQQGKTIDDLLEWQPNITMVCAEPFMNDKGFLDCSVIEDAVLKTLEHTKGGVIVKSVITPDIVMRLFDSLFDDDLKRLTFNPDLNIHDNPKKDFIEAKYQLIGGLREACAAVANIYESFTNIQAQEFKFASGPEILYTKLASDSFFALKKIWFNQVVNSAKRFECNYSLIINQILQDSRIGKEYMTIPDYDGMEGIANQDITKNIRAFSQFDKDLTLLNECVIVNNKYRKIGDPNVDNGQTEKELENQDD